MRVGSKKDEALQGLTFSLAEESDLLGDVEEALECAVTEVDDLGHPILSHEPIEQPHLIGDRVEIGPPRKTRKILAQSIASRIEVQRVGATEAQVIDYKPGKNVFPVWGRGEATMKSGASSH